MPFEASIIVCTHNPRADYFARALEALRLQTLPPAAWELIVVDSCSSPPLDLAEALKWHPAARVVREETIGVARARLRGMREAGGRILVFVDDDNLIQPDYLEVALRIEREFPILGVWGGSITGEFETPPPPSIRPWLGGLAVHEISRAYWSNVPAWSFAIPYGAGMCFRQEVAREYFRCVEESPIRLALGRTGRGLGAGEDSDIAFCCTRSDLGMGRFPELKLTHLISARRLTEGYMARMYAGFAHSTVYLNRLWNLPEPPPQNLLAGLLRVLRTRLSQGRMAGKIAYTTFWAERKAREELRALPPAPQAATMPR